MRQEVFDERVDRLRIVNAALQDLDPAIRAPAFRLLEDFVVRGDEGSILGEVAEDGGGPELQDFVARFNHEKPADNALLIAAFLYSRYGKESFSTEEVRDVAGKTGLTIPDRVDVTIGGAKRGGKALFQRVGRGTFAPTVRGELFFQATYEVSRGRKKKVIAADES